MTCQNILSSNVRARNIARWVVSPARDRPVNATPHKINIKKKRIIDFISRYICVKDALKAKAIEDHSNMRQMEPQNILVIFTGAQKTA